METLQDRVDAAMEQLKDKDTASRRSAILEWEKQARRKTEPETAALFIIELVLLDLRDGDFDGCRTRVADLLDKKGQARQTIVGVVQKMLELATQECGVAKETLLEASKSVSRGKMFLEQERTQATLLLSEMREQEGDIENAAREILEVPVETFSSVPKERRVSFLLRQMSLALRTGNYTRAEVVSNKFGERAFSGVGQQQREEFLCLATSLMACLGKYAQAARHCLDLFSQAVSGNTRTVGHTAVALSVLCGREVIEEVLSAKGAGLGEDFPFLRDFLRGRIVRRTDAMDWLFSSGDVLGFAGSLGDRGRGEAVARLARSFFEKTTDHNVAVLSTHYDAISLQSVSGCLGVSVAEAEERLCEMVLRKGTALKIDREDGFVYFTQKGEEWREAVARVLEAGEKVRRCSRKVGE
ncbi:MAG: 26S proteasome regulatory subunit N5, RPN5/PSMD12 [Amphiamblys sp. WSBS2006]|nr:MAG: 26S proteasome regulatory subunit N5, RPN5/PSMD12 [Amphiamblys sp. WSBS2006]